MRSASISPPGPSSSGAGFSCSRSPSAAALLSFRSSAAPRIPNFTIKVAIVTAIWPGATAPEMQDQVADRIEKKLQELPYFDKVRPTPKPGSSRCRSSSATTRRREVPQLFYQLRKKLGDLRGELPAGRQRTQCQRRIRRRRFGLYMLTGDGADFAQLKTVAEDLRQRLLQVPDVNKVNLYGVQDEKIFVEFSHAKLATLGIRPRRSSTPAPEQNAVVPAGTVESRRNAHAAARHRRARRREGGRRDAGRGGGPVFRLGDIATVTRGFEDPSDYPRAPGRQPGARRRRRHGEGRQHPRPRRGRRRRQGRS